VLAPQFVAPQRELLLGGDDRGTESGSSRHA
jgi:hypothetical protein